MVSEQRWVDKVTGTFDGHEYVGESIMSGVAITDGIRMAVPSNAFWSVTYRGTTTGMFEASPDDTKESVCEHIEAELACRADAEEKD
jgi:hypothetical protein